MSDKPLTHVFFELAGVLVDSEVLRREQQANLGRLMAQRYGRSAEDWSSAYGTILADWDSYYDDLNFNEDDGMAAIHEGMFRTTRALFRLTNTPEPNKTELTQLARELPTLTVQNSNVLFPEAADVLRQLDEAGLILGVISYSLTDMIEALLAPVRNYFKGTIWSVERSGYVDKDVQRYQAAVYQAQVAPEACVVVDDDGIVLQQAEEAGMQTIRVVRYMALPHPYLRDLHGVVERCLQTNPDRSER